MPLEQWEWMSIGTLTICLSAVTSSQVACGLSNPDVSLITISWTPMFTRPFAREPHSSRLCAGEMA